MYLAPPPRLVPKTQELSFPFPSLAHSTLYPWGHAPYLGQKRDKGDINKSLRKRDRYTIKTTEGKRVELVEN